jgi:hypothetical protein
VSHVVDRHKTSTLFLNCHSTVIEFVCDDSFRNCHDQTVMYQHHSCSDRVGPNRAWAGLGSGGPFGDL